MALIFDGFSSREQAEKFVEFVKNTYALKGDVFDSHEEMQTPTPDKLSDVFPFDLEPPIVLVERGETDSEVVQSVSQFGGSFAGT